MADRKKLKEARQGLQGHMEAMQEDAYLKTDQKMPAPEENKNILQRAWDTISKRDPDALNRILQPLQESTGAKMNEALSQIGQGNYFSGGLNVINSLLGVAASPFTLGDAILKEIPGGKGVSEALNKPFELASEGELYLQNALGNTLDKAGINSNLGLSQEQASQVNDALTQINQFGVQALLGSLAGTSAGMLKKAVIEPKPIPRTIDPYIEPKQIPEGNRTTFIGDEYGQNKRVVPETERPIVQELKTKRDNLEQSKVQATSRLTEITSEIKSLRENDELSNSTKKPKIKALRDESLKLNQSLEEINKQLEPINYRLDYYGERVDKWRPEGRLLPEHTGLGQPLSDMSGNNTPVNINFTKAKEGGHVISKMPDKMAPAMTGSFQDNLAGSRIEWVKDLIKSKPEIKDILQKGIQYGKEKETYDNLRKTAKKKGIADEDFRGAIMEILPELDPRENKPVEPKGFIPETATPEKSNIVPTDFNEKLKEYLRGEWRKKAESEMPDLTEEKPFELSSPEEPNAKEKIKSIFGDQLALGGETYKTQMPEKGLKEGLPDKSEETPLFNQHEGEAKGQEKLFNNAVKSEEVKPAEDHIISTPRGELPDKLSEKIKDQAEMKLSEVQAAKVQSQGPTFKRENVGNGWEVTGSTKAFTINSFPEWFSELGEKKERVVKALKKIIEDNGKDKGVLVERLKAIIVDHLKNGEHLSELQGHSGNFKKIDRGFVPPDEEFSKFFDQFKGQDISVEDLQSAFNEYQMKEMGKTKQPEAVHPELEKLKKLHAKAQAEYDFIADDPFVDDSDIVRAKKKVEAIEKKIKGFKPTEAPKSIPVSKDAYEKAKKNIIQKGQNLSSGIDPTLFKDYATVGAYHLGRGIDRFSDWSREMVREFGETIKPHLRAIYSSVQNESLKAKEAPHTTVEVRESIADNLISKSLDKAKQEKLRRAIDEYLGSHKVLTPNKVKDSMGLKEKVGLMAKKYGKAGGELAMRTVKGDTMREHLLKKAYEDYITPLKEMREKLGDLTFNIHGKKVIEALEDRKNAENILKSPEEKKMYDYASKFYDFFKGELKKSGFPVLEDYFTHILNVNRFEEILSDMKKPGEIDFRSLNHFISSESRFLKNRTDAEMPILKDLTGAMDTYAHSVTKALAYKDAVDYYYTDFLKDLPEAGGRPSMELAQKFMESAISPDVATGRLLKFIEKRRNTVYRALLWNNLKSAVQNGLQKELARMLMTPEAIKLTTKAMRSRELTGALADAMGELRRETPYYTELEKSSMKAESKLSRLSEAVGEKDLFQYMEKTNWKFSELGGIINSVVKTKEYKALRSSGLTEFDAISEALKRQSIFEKAVREGVDLSSRTQISPSPSYRPFFYDKPSHRIYAMFTRFKFGQLQLLAQTLFKPLEGAEGLRAQSILRRGVSDDVKPVETLRAVEYYRKNLEVLEKKMKKEPQADIGVEEKFVRQYIDYLKTKETELNGVIKTLEPLNGDRGKMALRWANYFAKSAAVSLSFTLLTEAISNAVKGSMGFEEDKEKSKGEYAWQVIKDINATPFYGFNPNSVVSNPLLPNIDLFLFNNLNKRGASRSLISWAMNVTPGLGIASRLLRFSTGIDAPIEATNAVFPLERGSRSSGRRAGRSAGESVGR